MIIYMSFITVLRLQTFLGLSLVLTVLVQFLNLSHSDIDELIQRNMKREKARLGLIEHVSQRRLHSVKCQ